MLLALLALRTGVAMVILFGSPCDTAMGPSQAATDAKPVSKIEASASPCSSQHAQKATNPAKPKPKADEGPGPPGLKTGIVVSGKKIPGNRARALIETHCHSGARIGHQAFHPRQHYRGNEPVHRLTIGNGIDRNS
jgi:hypothetical protein